MSLILRPFSSCKKWWYFQRSYDKVPMGLELGSPTSQRKVQATTPWAPTFLRFPIYIRITNPLNTDNNKFPKKMIAIRIIFSAICQNGIRVLHYGIPVFHYGSWVLHSGIRDWIFFILGSEFCIMGSEFCILGSEFVFLCYERVNKSRDQWTPLIEDGCSLSTD